MSYYNVIRECVVGKLHYARPTTQPIEVDAEVAAPLVEAGDLEPYAPASVEALATRARETYQALGQAHDSGGDVDAAITEAAAAYDQYEQAATTEAKSRRARRTRGSES